MTKFKSLKVGEILSETQFYKVARIKGSEVELSTETGESVTVSSEYVDKLITSASQFDKIEKLNKTDGAALLIASAHVAMTVSFNKKVDEKEVIEQTVKEVEGSNIGDIRKAITKAIKKTISGEERVIVGKHNGNVNNFGRLTFIDMEKTAPDNVRQVDPREINYLILRGVKIEIK